MELFDEDFAPERFEPEDFAPERVDEDFFAEARPVVRFDEPRPEDGPAVRPVDFAEELRPEELRPDELPPEEPREDEPRDEELRLEPDLPEELEPDPFDEADFELDFFAVDLLAVDLECDFELGLEAERLEPREDFEELLLRGELEELRPRARAFSG